MEVNERVKITNTDSIWDDKEGTIESIDGDTVTVYVEFNKEENKFVRQIFNINNLSSLSSEPEVLTEAVQTYYRVELYEGRLNLGGIVAASFEVIPTRETIEDWPEDFAELDDDVRAAYYKYDDLMHEIFDKIYAPAVKVGTKFAFTHATFNEVKPLLAEMNNQLKIIDPAYHLEVKEVNVDDSKIKYADKDQVAFIRENKYGKL